MYEITVVDIRNYEKPYCYKQFKKKKGLKIN